LSGVVYLFNDFFDREQDRLHPEKRHRPIAAGKISIPLAMGAALVLLVFALAFAFWLHPHFGFVALIYAALNVAYSLKLKHVVLVDVLIVATGFLLRALGGALVIEVFISTWFIICIFMLALFLAVVKRRQEIVALEEAAGDHRAILDEYSLLFLDQTIAALTAAILVCYALYAMGVGDGQGGQMRWTIPFVLYGLLRYLYLVYHRGGGDDPTTVIWSDRPMQITALLWMAASALGLYLLP
jgi:4-hydroxybenzoate polyprenyltransferase